MAELGHKHLVAFAVNIKGIVIEYNNIFVWHKSEDINKNRLFQNFQLILI